MSVQPSTPARCYHICHHGDAALEAWYREHETDDADEEPDEPSFANDEADVDIDLLEADD